MVVLPSVVSAGAQMVTTMPLMTKMMNPMMIQMMVVAVARNMMMVRIVIMVDDGDDR